MMGVGKGHLRRPLLDFRSSKILRETHLGAGKVVYNQLISHIGLF